MKTGWFRAFVAAAVTLLPLLARADMSVAIVNPTNNQTFTKPVNVLMQAAVTTTSVSNNILRVNFYVGTTVSLTTMIGSQMAPDAHGFYDVTWTNPPTGNFALLAVAIDYMEHRATSAPVMVTIKSNLDNILPVVTVAAADSQATETPGNPGVYTIYRTGSTNDPLTVFYNMSGSASNGVDYTTLPGSVTIAAGDHSAQVILQPIDDAVPEATETATLSLRQPPFAAPTTYMIGSPNSANVSIVDNETNLPPLVALVNPTNGASFNAPTNVLLQAQASDPDGSIFKVYFFNGSTPLGGVTTPDSLGLYNFVWTNPPPGNYTLTAMAIDNLEAHSTSAPVIISIIGTPPSNSPPTVHIYSPTNNASFNAPANIFIGAEAFDKDGYVATVEFFENGISLGVKTNNPMSGSSINPFYIYWTNVPIGAYDLTALATDNKGASTLSVPIHVTVHTPPPPPTNYLPVVRISSPPNGAMYHAPVNIPIYVYSFDPDGSIAGVEVFAGTNDLGPALRPCHTTTNGTTECPTNYFLITWSNAPIGNFALTAVATDNVGDSKRSEPVNISILPPPPPPSNHPPVVTITASDPIAIEGTNCWVRIAPTNTITWSNWVTGTALPVLVTNCGPKSATFHVRRDGSTNTDLTVNYEIGGTATNGIQYLTLAGSVTIPAGEHGALITVVPIDDGPPEINMTVILKIKVSTNYYIGYPGRAAAYILDGPQLRTSSELTLDRCFHLKADGPDGAWFHVDYTTDFVSWTPVCTNQVVNGSIDFVDPDAQGDQLRYYRAVPQDAAPPQ